MIPFDEFNAAPMQKKTDAQNPVVADMIANAVASVMQLSLFVSNEKAHRKTGRRPDFPCAAVCYA